MNYVCVLIDRTITQKQVDAALVNPVLLDELEKLVSFFPSLKVMNKVTLFSTKSDCRPT